MAEEETQIETPTEPHIIDPKSSPLMRALSNLRTRGDFFNKISTVELLSKAKFPVYLAKGDSGNDKLFAVKIFPLKENEEPNPYYQNEIRFASLDHKNIIKTLHFEPRRPVDHKGAISFIVSEYARNGDFFNFVTKYREHFNDKLARTYFRQLIEGLEHLHKKGAAHLDLKLENLLLAEDYTLKIADFDLSYFKNDANILSTGTKYFRSPELKESTCKNYQAADIYSAGVLLFVFKTGGVLPHSEDVHCRGISLFDLLYEEDNAEFWKSQCHFQDRSLSFFSFDFKTLFNGMIKLSPEKRFTLKAVKRSNWYNGPVYTKEELKEYVQSFWKKASDS